MQRSIVVIGMALLGALSSVKSWAQAEWSSRSEVGFVAARGNTVSETANAKFEITRETQDWKNFFGASGLYGRASRIESAQRWDARYQLDRNIRAQTFWFVGGRYEDDRYSGFAYQGTATAGFGRKFYDTQLTKLTSQIGAGYRSLRQEDLIRDDANAVIARIPGERSSDMVVNAALTYEHSFNENTRILSSLLIESGQANTLTRNDLSFQVKMNDVLALSLGLSVRNNSEPQPGLKNTDTLTTVNLVYATAP